MYWANFLHIYQPPTQKEIWIKRITDESYRKLLGGLLKVKRARLTLNINGVLCDFLAKYGGEDVLDMINALLKAGIIELTGSAKYHAFLPLLPEAEIERQILLNEESLKKYFGVHWKKQGFFSPEMAYSKSVATVAARLGYHWLIMDEMGFPAGHQFAPDKIFDIKGLDNFSVFFRERAASFKISGAQLGSHKVIISHHGERVKKNEYLVTAMDGEIFGHHRPGLETLLFDLYNEAAIEPAMVSDLINLFPKRETIEPRESNWAVNKNDLKEGRPFARWKRDDNAVQVRQWKLTELALAAAHRDPSEKKLRAALDAALHSDQYWWASVRPWWSLEMIERGAHELRRIVLESKTATAKEKAEAEELYKEIIYTGFEWQRSGYVDELSRHEDEEVQQRLEEKEKFFITKDEYQHMIQTIEEQMEVAAKNREYHRAGALQERIRELKEEMKKHHGTTT